MSALYQLRAFFAQSFFIPSPPLTEHNLPDQSNRICIITGGYAGVGFELVSILYQHNATIYIAGRSEQKAASAIDRLHQSFPQSSGKLHFLKVDLSDLTTIKPAVQSFLARETKLHWLNNNAGVMRPPEDAKGVQGLDLQYQTNIYGPFLLTKLLQPVLKATAAAAAAEGGSVPGSVRVTWAGSLATVLTTPPGGVAWLEDGSDYVHAGKSSEAYHISKAANYLLSCEFGRRSGTQDGVLHVAYNPGNLASDLARHLAKFSVVWVIAMLITWPPKMGAYTELYAGISKDLTLEKDQGGWIVPWGRRYPMREDILAETVKEGAEREESTASRCFEWCEKVTGKFQ